MTTIEEMVETFSRVMLDNNWPGVTLTPEAFERGLLAVIEKHIGPLVADAFSKGSEEARAHRPDATRTQEYAVRILSALTATGRET